MAVWGCVAAEGEVVDGGLANLACIGYNITTVTIGGAGLNENVLELNGLSVSLLAELSYPVAAEISLKRTLKSVPEELLLADVFSMAEWLDEQEALSAVALDYRIKSFSSIEGKYNRYLNSELQIRKVFNDVLGFRGFCGSYEDVLAMDLSGFRIADMSYGKANDDGYRGVHVYFQLDGRHYPIEIQFNTLYDRQLNNWLHDYLYKQGYPNAVGQKMREYYEQGVIRNENHFREVLDDVLSGC